MTLLLSNDDVRQVLDMQVCLESVECNYTSTLVNQRYQEMGEVRDHMRPLDIPWGSLPDLGDLVVASRAAGRTGNGQVTGFVNNIGKGAQFAAVGTRVLELAKAKSLGRELPTEWFLEDVHP